MVLAALVLFVGWRAYSNYSELRRKKEEINGRAFKHLEVPLEDFGAYKTLPTQVSFTTYYPEPGENITTYTINRYGMRDVDFPRDKPSGEFRIAVLGDSFTEGVLVEQDRIYSVWLEKLLNRPENRSQYSRIRVMNFGMRGEWPKMYIQRLKHQIMKFEPDMVMVQTFDNDAWDGFRHMPYAQNGERNRFDYLYESSDFWDQAIEQVVRDLEELRTECIERRLPLVVVHVPVLFMVDHENKTYYDDRYESAGMSIKRDSAGRMVNPLHNALQEWASEKSVTFVQLKDLLNEYKKRKPEQLYFNDDGHFNERGHVVVAELLAPVLARVIKESAGVGRVVKPVNNPVGKSE